MCAPVFDQGGRPSGADAADGGGEARVEAAAVSFTQLSMLPIHALQLLA